MPLTREIGLDAAELAPPLSGQMAIAAEFGKALTVLDADPGLARLIAGCGVLSPMQVLTGLRVWNGVNNGEALRGQPPDEHAAVAGEIYIALTGLHAPQQLLGCVVEWSDRPDDAGVLEELRSFNARAPA